MAGIGRAFPAQVPRFGITVGTPANADRADTPSGPGIPVIVTVDDPLPQQAIKYVAAIAAAVGVVAQVAGDIPPGVNIPKIVVLPDDPLPTLGRVKLPQGGPAAAFVPFTRHLEVLGAWEPIRFSIPAPVKIAAITPRLPDVVPPLPRHMETILAAWAPLPPTPVLPPKEAAIIPAPVVAGVPPPFVRRTQDWTPWDVAVPVRLVVSSAATEGAAAPSPPAVPDNPPFVRRTQDWTPWDVAIPVKLVVTSVPPEGVTPTPPPVAGDNPPFGLHRFTAWAWGPLVAYPGGGGEFVPQAGGDDPPFNQRRMPDWSHWFQPGPLPTLTRKLTPPTGPAAPVITPDNPSGRGVPRIVTVADDPLPQVSRKLLQAAIPPVAGDNPPFGLHRFTAWSWGPLVAYPGGGGEFVPQAAAPAVTPPDNPSGRGVPRIITVVDDPLPQVNRKLPQGVIPPLPGDNPPFSQRQTQDWTHFYPPPPLPTLTVKLPQVNVLPPLGDNPPFNQRHTQNWTHWFPPYPPDPLPTLQVKLTPPTGPEIVVVEPPPTVVTTPGGVWRSGRPLYKRLKLKKKLKREQCDELLEYLRSLPLPAAVVEVIPASAPPTATSLLDCLPKQVVAQVQAAIDDDEEEEDIIALLLEILNA